ncbi:hypothetical protein K491DRAFT_696984, partial [Lophiostoma macrostomum CBS 122681]
AEDSEVELEVLVGHRELGEWKIAYFKQYHMERELHLVQQSSASSFTFSGSSDESPSDPATLQRPALRRWNVEQQTSASSNCSGGSSLSRSTSLDSSVGFYLRLPLRRA